jgi:S1-C subfamily serine protease
MNKKNKYQTIVLLSILIGLSSCGTIFSGSKTKINLNIDDSTSVYEDGVKLNPIAKTIKLKSKRNHTIIMKKDGYKDVIHELKPFYNNICFYNSLTALASIPFFANIGNNKDGGQMGRFYLSFGVMFGVPVTLNMIDAITSSNKVLYPQKLTWRAVNIPPINDPKNTFPIGCADVNVKIKIGEKIGTISNFGNVYSEIFWENTVNVKSEDLEVIVNNSLKDYGFNVPKEFGNNGFKIDAQIIGININNDNAYSKTITECKLNTKWTVTDIATNEVVKTETLESYNVENSKGIHNAFLSSFENSFLIFLSNSKELYENTKKSTEELIATSTGEVITIKKPILGNKLNLKELTSSVVTVTTGDNSGHGSGFFISEDGLIVTNYHVVKNSKKVNIILSNNLSFVGDVIRTDINNDLALVKISGNGFKPFLLSESEDNNQIGAEVYAIGTPNDKKLSQTVSKGIVSGNRLLDDKSYIQTDVSVSPGNSGGPLIDKNGIVLGVITLKVIDKGVEGLSFALPSSSIFTFLNLKYVKK